MRYCFIVNEKSNSSRSKAYIDENSAKILKQFPHSAIINVQDPSKIDQIIEDKASNFDVLVACGGDGTVQTVGKHAHRQDKILGIIPLGSGNDFVKNLGIKPKMPIEYYIRILKSNNVINADVTSLNGIVFLNTVGIGFDGLTNVYARKFTRLKGKARYAVAGMKAFFTSRRFKATIKYSDGVINDDFWLIAFTNGKVEGGLFKLSPNSNIDDGIAEMVLFRGYNRLKLIYAFMRLLLKRDLNDTLRQIISVKEAEVSINPNQFVHYDGESKSVINRANFKIEDKKLKVLTLLNG